MAGEESDAVLQRRKRYLTNDEVKKNSHINTKKYIKLFKFIQYNKYHEIDY